MYMYRLVPRPPPFYLPFAFTIHVASFPGSSAPEREIEVVHAESLGTRLGGTYVRTYTKRDDVME